MIQNIKLKNFRNFDSKNLEFSKNITVISGRNAAGKTNILESLFLISTGKSFKAKKEIETIRYEQDLGSIKGITKENVLDLIITKGENGWPKKKLMVNGVAKRLIDFAGQFKTVLFGPWDMDLVSQSPSLRRRFLDNVLSQVDREYRRSILSYEKGVRQRNKLLFRIREERLSPGQLLFWNQLLIKNGDYITKKRQEFIDFANRNPRLNDHDFFLEYDKSVISEARIAQYKNEEIAAATTLVGPHRDDFSFKEKDRDLASFGSRGEQRMGILWIKMSELNFIEEETLFENANESHRPTLLLDDIFSELDHKHRDVVMDLAKRQQTIITTAEDHFLEGMSGFDIINI